MYDTKLKIYDVNPRTQ